MITTNNQDCVHCGYAFVPRVESPKKCPKCQKSWPLGKLTSPYDPPQQVSSMNEDIQHVANGTVTSAKGYLAGATFAGLKTYAEDKLDLAIIFSKEACSTAGVFTTNRLKSHSVALTQERITLGKARAVVVDSGIANACVGEQGYKDAWDMTGRAAQHLGIEAEAVLICSTGVIGVELPMSLVNAGIDRIELLEDGGHLVARAIVTTDTFTKEIAVSFELDGTTITVGGVAKGSGMIHPNMATMLCFITSDAEIKSDLLKEILANAVDESFNMITVDGDTSTNDTVLAFANGAAGACPITRGSEGERLLGLAIKQVCTKLAREITTDGEGASKLIEVTVEGAKSLEEARSAARTVAGSSLVKTAVHGNDPNWGRVVAALGRGGAEVLEEKIALYVNDVCIMEDGRPVPFHKDSIIAIMSGPEVSFRICLNLGNARATAWGCNLSEEYVTFNSAYTT